MCDFTNIELLGLLECYNVHLRTRSKRGILDTETISFHQPNFFFCKLWNAA